MSKHPKPIDMARDTFGPGDHAAAYALGVKQERDRLAKHMLATAEADLAISKAKGATPEGYEAMGSAAGLFALAKELQD